MKDVHIAFGVLTITLNTAACLFGAWCWWRSSAHLWFWRLLRVAQASLVVQAALGAVLVLLGNKPPSLHVVYGLLPLAVSFIGEQLRISSAETILDARGFESAAEVGELPEDEQRGVVAAIVTFVWLTVRRQRPRGAGRDDSHQGSSSL